LLAQKSKEITVAVLPFKVLMDKEGLNLVISGFIEDLITNFSKFIGLSVISQYSTQHIEDIGDENAIARLGADYLVTGSFRSTKDGVRIGIQLIRTEDCTVVFGGKHDETWESVLHTQDVITEQIVSVLQQQIDYDLLSYSYKKESIQLAAYENWLIGMDHLKKGTLDNDLKAREHFEAALKIDPHYARAYTGISLSYFNEWSCLLWDRWDITQKGAHEYALKALEYDENDYISLTVLGRTFLYLGQYEKAEHYLRKSIRMNPSDADNLVQVAFSMVYLGYANEAEKLYKKAQKLNPMHQDGYFPYGAFIYFELGDFKKSVELSEKVKLASAWTDFSAFMAATYYYLSEYEKMEASWKNYIIYFKKNIHNGDEVTQKQALEWMIMINPFKGKTNLQEFWEHMGSEINGEITQSVSISGGPAKSTQEASFIKDGDMWKLIFLGQKVLVKDVKGYHDIAKLLLSPNKEIHCTELIGSIVQDFDSKVDTIDLKAKNNYQKRIRELQMEIAEADEIGNSVQSVALQEEYETILDYLSQSLGLAGKPRQIGSSTEKARSAVTWRIRYAIKKIKAAHPSLAKHFSVSVKTGTFCSYSPESNIKWSL
jgi:TolB-like protein/Tfp pilus assembly protein PilF